MNIKKLTPQQWAELSEKAHLIVFGKNKPASMDRIDYALLCEDDKNILGYITVREQDSESVYWQFGGTFPGTRSTIKAFHVFQAFIRWARENCKRVAMLVENTNTAMLKFAMKMGFRIVGIRNFQGNILLEHLLEFGG